jgi:hypothetical protein
MPDDLKFNLTLHQGRFSATVEDRCYAARLVRPIKVSSVLPRTILPSEINAKDPLYSPILSSMKSRLTCILLRIKSCDLAILEGF